MLLPREVPVMTRAAQVVRERVGASSVASAIALGVRPPRPTPASRRNRPMARGECAPRQASVASAWIATPPSNMVRRP